MNPGMTILIFGFILFASVFGGGDKKIEALEHIAKVIYGFIASVFTISGLFMLIIIPIWLLAALLLTIIKQISKMLKKPL